ncbi:MAG TPA: SDR family NAD(P)-dependent oxidoreductase [Thermomicrobiales bacterium]|nr:SDR family NAD(P)-dependent oxidoreductase [Thermomicrobiales bacterium]
MLADLHDRVVLVTGGTGSLGRGVVAELKAANATVVSTAHRPSPSPIDGVEIEVADLRDPGEAVPLVERIVARHERIDALVCLVGGFTSGTFIQTDHQTWHEMVELNLNTAVIAARAALPGMVERKYGRIVTVGSRPAIDPTPNTAAYSAAKAAVIAMTRSLGRELRGSGVTANCILPSTIDTPQNRESMPRADPSRWVAPEAIGKVVTFLCSDAAGVIRGAAIPVYGDV